MKKIPMVKKPCSHCPFKKDTLKGWLNHDRADDIANSSSFACHKTGETNSGPRKQCAGFMILKKEESAFYKILNHAARQFLMKHNNDIFESKEDFIKHHSNE